MSFISQQYFCMIVRLENKDMCGRISHGCTAVLNRFHPLFCETGSGMLPDHPTVLKTLDNAPQIGHLSGAEPNSI